MNTVTAPKKNTPLIILICIFTFLIGAMAVVYFVVPPSAITLDEDDFEQNTRTLFENYFEASYYTDKVISSPRDFKSHAKWQSGLLEAKELWKNTEDFANALSSSFPDNESLFSFLDEFEFERTSYAKDFFDIEDDDSLFGEDKDTDSVISKTAIKEISRAVKDIKEDALLAIEVLDKLNNEVYDGMPSDEILDECESASKKLIKKSEFNVTFGALTARGGILIVNEGKKLAVTGADILLIDNEVFLSSDADYTYIKAIPGTCFPEGSVIVISSKTNRFAIDTNSKISSGYDNLAFTVDSNGVTDIKSLTSEEYNSYVSFFE